MVLPTTPHSVDTPLRLVVRDARGSKGIEEEACGVLATLVADLAMIMELANVDIFFVEAEVSFRLGSIRVRRNVYATSWDESEQSANLGGSLPGRLRSVDSLIPQSDSLILYQGLNRAIRVPRLGPSDDQVSDAKQSEVLECRLCVLELPIDNLPRCLLCCL
ncbi:hypothetical protein GW17_00054895 [Ensete ventricosum]|nr:hypothetical protein GW17_00054895 [Ensete ventricosum]